MASAAEPSDRANAHPKSEANRIVVNVKKEHKLRVTRTVFRFTSLAFSFKTRTCIFFYYIKKKLT